MLHGGVVMILKSGGKDKGCLAGIWKIRTKKYKIRTGLNLYDD